MDAPPCNNVLMSIANYVGPLNGSEAPLYREVTAAIVETFRVAGLIDFKGGKSHSSALSQAAGSGNYHMCELLLTAGAGTSLSVILISPTGIVSCGGGLL